MGGGCQPLLAAPGQGLVGYPVYRSAKMHHLTPQYQPSLIILKTRVLPLPNTFAVFSKTITVILLTSSMYQVAPELTVTKVLVSCFLSVSRGAGSSCGTDPQTRLHVSEGGCVSKRCCCRRGRY